MKIDHIALGARDSSTLASWYERWFGLRREFVLRSNARPPVVFLIDESGQRIEIVPRSTGQSRSIEGRFPHLAFSVEDVDRELERLQRAGIDVIEDRRTSAGWRIAYFTDPEGNLLELVERLSGVQEYKEDTR